MHTPGPWEIAEDFERNDHGAFILRVFSMGNWPDGRDPVFAPANAYGEDLPEAQANARLIAAAPRLVEVLRSLLDNEDAAELSYQTDLIGAAAGASAMLWVLARSRARALLAELGEEG